MHKLTTRINNAKVKALGGITALLAVASVAKADTTNLVSLDSGLTTYQGYAASTLGVCVAVTLGFLAVGMLKKARRGG